MFLLFHLTIYFADDEMNSIAQYLITIENGTANLGDLSHIINLENETICVKFESHTGKNHFSQYEKLDDYFQNCIHIS